MLQLSSAEPGWQIWNGKAWRAKLHCSIPRRTCHANSREVWRDTKFSDWLGLKRIYSFSNHHGPIFKRNPFIDVQIAQIMIMISFQISVCRFISTFVSLSADPKIISATPSESVVTEKEWHHIAKFAYCIHLKLSAPYSGTAIKSVIWHWPFMPNWDSEITCTTFIYTAQQVLQLGLLCWSSRSRWITGGNWVTGNLGLAGNASTYQHLQFPCPSFLMTVLAVIY